LSWSWIERKLFALAIDGPTAHFKGKTIRVSGVVIRKEDQPYIEVTDPRQIEMVK
jgi:hypothetical protein